MDNLSGGEKTVAALALLFAIHRCRFTGLSATMVTLYCLDYSLVIL